MTASNFSHRSGQGWLTTWTPQMVAAAPDPVVAFAEYVQQTLGVPWPTAKDLVILRTKIKEFFSHYPRATFHSLCRVVGWCRARQVRCARVYGVVRYCREAWVAGQVPEMDRLQHHEQSVDDRIQRALEVEADPTWRRRLVGTMGVEPRRATVTEWEAQRAA